jgi:hypothetical protein
VSTADVDIRVRVRGGGHTSQIYAIRQAIAKSIVSLLVSTVVYTASLRFTAGRRGGRTDGSFLADRLLPEVHRRAQQEPAQAGTCRLRPHTPRCRQQAMRAQEVWWSRCACAVPEVIQIGRESRRDAVESKTAGSAFQRGCGGAQWEQLYCHCAVAAACSELSGFS